MEVFIKVEDTILECTMRDSVVVVRVGDVGFNPFYRIYTTDYLSVDHLINELLSYTNDIIISDDIYEVL